MEISEFIARRIRLGGKIRHVPALGQKACWQIFDPQVEYPHWRSIPKSEMWTDHIYPLLEDTPDSESWEALRLRLQRWTFASRIMQLLAPRIR